MVMVLERQGRKRVLFKALRWKQASVHVCACECVYLCTGLGGKAENQSTYPEKGR